MDKQRIDIYALDIPERVRDAFYGLVDKTIARYETNRKNFLNKQLVLERINDERESSEKLEGALALLNRSMYQLRRLIER